MIGASLYPRSADRRAAQQVCGKHRQIGVSGNAPIDLTPPWRRPPCRAGGAGHSPRSTTSEQRQTAAAAMAPWPWRCRRRPTASVRLLNESFEQSGGRSEPDPAHLVLDYPWKISPQLASGPSQQAGLVETPSSCSSSRRANGQRLHELNRSPRTSAGGWRPSRKRRFAGEPRAQGVGTKTSLRTLRWACLPPRAGYRIDRLAIVDSPTPKDIVSVIAFPLMRPENPERFAEERWRWRLRLECADGHSG